MKPKVLCHRFLGVTHKHQISKILSIIFSNYAILLILSCYIFVKSQQTHQMIGWLGFGYGDYTSFNNISAISWRVVLLVEETRVPRENHRHATSH